MIEVLKMESCNESFSSLAEDLLGNIQDNFNSIIGLIEDTKPKKFYRKIRTRKGIKRRYMICVNPLNDILIDSLHYPVQFIRRYLESKHEKI